MVDYNVNIGVEIDREHNKKEFLRETFYLPHFQLTVFGPNRIFGGIKFLRDSISRKEKKLWRVFMPNLTFTLLLRFKTNLVVSDKGTNENDGSNFETHFVMFEGKFKAVDF